MDYLNPTTAISFAIYTASVGFSLWALCCTADSVLSLYEQFKRGR